MPTGARSPIPGSSTPPRLHLREATALETADARRPLESLAPLELPRRYLVGFNPLDMPHHFTDVLIIGGGLAGLRTALGIDRPYRVLVVTKDEVRESNSNYAQGGIAGVLDPEDHFEDHI